MPSSPRKFTIGRDKTCDVPIADDSVSRLHAELTFLDDGTMTLTDCKSSNGTKLFRQGKSHAVQQETIHEVDRVQFGEVLLQVRDIVDVVRRKHPELPGGEPAYEPDPAPAGKLVRCECGAIKGKGQRCPSCGQ